MNEDTYTISSGHLDVGDGHKIYYQEWGNENASPIFFLHGGPIYHCKDKHKLAFDPKKHHVIFHDQRGGGNSIASDIFKANTADDRANDIEMLRQHFNFEQIQVFGFSWGSTLALYYAELYPRYVAKMLVGNVYTSTNAETGSIFQGDLATAFPEAWQYYIEPVPEEQREDTLAFYEAALQKGSDDQKRNFMQRFMQLEPASMSIDADYAKLLQDIQLIDNLDELQNTLLSIRWFRNNCFIPENFIMENADKLAAIPTVIVQGRFDLVCKAHIAEKLARAIGTQAHLHFIPASHAVEGSMREVQRAYAWSFLD